MHQLTLRQLCDALAAGKISSVEATQFFLNKIKELNSLLGCFITIDEERSLNEARVADARRARGLAGPLNGAPIEIGRAHV